MEMSEGKPNNVVSHDAAYVGELKIYNTGIKEDPVPGEKRGKGVQALNSSYWLADLGSFIAKHLSILQKILGFAFEKSKKAPGSDFIYLINYSNQLSMKAENEGLKTCNSLDFFLMACWLAMAAAEVDSYYFSRLSTEERKASVERFYKIYREAEIDQDVLDKDILGKYAVEQSRVDLIPAIALERLGIHNELCAIKWKDPTVWKKEGFEVSKRISSLKRHFDGVHAKDYSEDHIAHLIWNFMAMYHVVKVFPNLNDLTNYEELRKNNSLKSNNQ